MGNFYTNVTLRTDCVHALVAQLRTSGRDAYVCWVDRIAIVVDREAETQDTEALAALAHALSSALSAPALACLNHDDDALVLGLYDCGALVREHGWSRSGAFQVPRSDRSQFVKEIRRLFELDHTAPPAPGSQDVAAPGQSLLWRALNIWSQRTFAIAVHEAIVMDAGLPRACIGAGFRYVSRGDVGDVAPGFVHV